MLRPVANAVRETKTLNGLWDFAIDTSGTGRVERWWQRKLSGARTIAVPSSYNDLLVDAAVHDHVGDAWYQRSVFIPRGWDGQRIRLRFDAATHRATVWVNDDEVTTHEGGYTPFEADITDQVRQGEEVRVTAVVNNELSLTSMPPGMLDERSDGTPRQIYFHDFFNYAGLHRSVWLYTVPSIHIDDVTVTTDLEGEIGVVRYLIEVAGDDQHRDGLVTRTVLRTEDGDTAAEGTGATGELRVADPVLWRPGHGYLYELEVSLWRGEHLVDRYALKVGIRTVAVDGSQFLINGEPFHFRGFGMHEDHHVHGKGHDPASVIHDLALLEWTGANSFRTSHYPYAEEWLDLADQLGLAVIDETPAVGFNFHGHGDFPFGDVDSQTREAHRRTIEALIHRDKNHPSVVLWSVANEPESHTEASRTFFEPLFATVRATDPTRPVGFANMIIGTPETCRLTELGDVVMLNRYYGWYRETGDLASAEDLLEAELVAWSQGHGKPILVTEYGADALAGEHSVLPEPWTEDYQAELIDMCHRVFDRIDAVVGEHVWNFADFATAPSPRRAHGNRKGVFTRDRRPKAVAHHLRKRWRGQP